MKKIYLLIKEGLYAEEGYYIIAGFNRKKVIDNYVKKKYPDYKKNKNNDYELKSKKNKYNGLIEYEYLIVEEIEIITTTKGLKRE